MAAAGAAEVTLRVRRFDMKTLKPDRTILLIGKRGTGKSTLLKDIMYHMRHMVDAGFAMTPTYDTQKMFEDCLPQAHIYNSYSIDTVRNMISVAGQLKEKKKMRHMLLAIDDCMFDKKIMQTIEMRELHMNGRHLHISFINSVQYCMDLSPALRTQIDYVFCLKENVIANRKRLHQYFFGGFNSFDDFANVMDACTNNHEALVLDNTQPSNNPSDCLFYYRAEPSIGRFRLGKSVFWRLAHMYRKQQVHQTLADMVTSMQPPRQRIKRVQKETTVKKDDEDE